MNPLRHRITVEISVPATSTRSETRDWIQSWFSFFHPSLRAQVKEVQEDLEPANDDSLL